MTRFLRARALAVREMWLWWIVAAVIVVPFGMAFWAFCNILPWLSELLPPWR